MIIEAFAFALGSVSFAAPSAGTPGPGAEMPAALADGCHPYKSKTPACKLRERKEAAERFRRADKNHNGALSKEEAKALPGVLAHYDQMDADHNGELTPEEIGRYVRGRIEQRRRQREAVSTQP